MTASASFRLPPLRGYVDGDFVEPTLDLGVSLENPNTGEQVARQLAHDDATVARALAAAQRVHAEGSWSGLSANDRADWLERLADALAPKCEAIAALESFNTGATIQTTGMVSFIVHAAFRLVADQLRSGLLLDTSFDGPSGRQLEVHRLPLGPAVCLVPWNAPAPMAAHKVASALGAGAPAILKPSEWAPYGSSVIAEAAAEIGLPAGVLQVVHGGPHVGGLLVTDKRTKAVSFTGGLGGGRAIAAACAQDFKPAQLELGGNNAVVVLDDADLDAAAGGVVALLTTLNGQWCRALGRLVVAESVAEELVAKVSERLAALRIGDSLDPASAMGPIVHSGHRELLAKAVDSLVAAGGTAIAPSPLPALGGSFFAPTLITGLSSDDFPDEVFGPVGVVLTAKDDAEAVLLANDTEFGLEGYVFGGDEGRAMAVARQIRAGGVKVNGASIMSLHLMAPRPAWGLSGLGTEGTIETITFFTGQRVVGVEGWQ